MKENAVEFLTRIKDSIEDAPNKTGEIISNSAYEDFYLFSADELNELFSVLLALKFGGSNDN